MNCPHCRKKLWYMAGLSEPPQLKTYLCYGCKLLFGFVPLTFKRGTLLWGGYRVVEGVVRKTGYTAPSVMKRDPTKGAPSPGRNHPVYTPRRG